MLREVHRCAWRLPAPDQHSLARATVGWDCRACHDREHSSELLASITCQARDSKSALSIPAEPARGAGCQGGLRRRPRQTTCRRRLGAPQAACPSVVGLSDSCAAVGAIWAFRGQAMPCKGLPATVLVHAAEPTGLTATPTLWVGVQSLPPLQKRMSLDKKENGAADRVLGRRISCKCEGTQQLCGRV